MQLKFEHTSTNFKHNSERMRAILMQNFMSSVKGALNNFLNLNIEKKFGSRNVS